jgi:hypothetical protein
VLSHGQPGSQVLGALLNTNQGTVPGYSSIYLRELIAVATWYIWWMRRRRSHGDQVPPIQKCAISIRAIIANSARAKTHANTLVNSKWVRPRCHVVKLNVDTAFMVEDHNGAAGAGAVSRRREFSC